MSVHLTGSAAYSFGDLCAAAFWGRSATARWVFVAAILLLTLYHVLINDFDDWDDVLYALMLPLMLLGIGAVALLLVLWTIYRRMSRDHRLMTYDIDGERLVFGDGVGGSTTLPWQRLETCHEHGSGFALFLKPAGAAWLIKRAFPEADLEAFRGLARERLGAAARLRRAR
jgi:hypothetical protein